MKMEPLLRVNVGGSQVKITCISTARNTPGDPTRTVKTKEEIMELAYITVSLEYGCNTGW